MQFVRQSKFRHVFCKPLKTEQCLSDVRVSKISWDGSFAAVNSKYMAVITEGAGGPFMVFPVNKTGRVEKDCPIVDAHKAPCLDIAWCPFNDNVIASCSEDTTAKVWLIPDKGLIRNLTEPIVELLGHQKRVTNVLWHPTAANVLLTSGADLRLLIWNVGTGEALIEIAGHPDLIWSVAFNYNGSKVVTTCKDKKVRVIDPRSGAILQQGYGHDGMKPQRAIFMKDGRILTTGFTRRSERMYALRDEEALDEPIVQEELDTSNGVLLPLYDADTGLLYLVGKGDCSIRYYEVNDDAPFIHYINTHTASEPQRGIGFMPKLGLHIADNEISRVYKFTNKGVVEVLPFFVPRKSELFQDDLYPPTAGTKPALTAEQWMQGMNADPILVPLSPGAADSVVKKAPVKKANILADMSQSSGANDPTSSQQSSAAPPPAKPSMRLAQSAPKERYEPAVSVPADSGIVLNTSKAHKPADTAVIVPDEPPPPPPPTVEPPRWQKRLERLEKQPSDEQHRPLTDSYRQQRESVSSSMTITSQPPPTPTYSSAAPDLSLSRQNSMAGGGAEVNWPQLVEDVHKMKLIIRKHERRIRYLEDLLAEKDRSDDVI